MIESHKSRRRAIQRVSLDFVLLRDKKSALSTLQRQLVILDLTRSQPVER